MLRVAGLAVALAGVLALAVPASADYETTITFRAKTPTCEANPGAPWLGRVSGQAENPITKLPVPASFVGCFKTKAECDRWRTRGTALMLFRLVENVCEPR